MATALTLAQIQSLASWADHLGPCEMLESDRPMLDLRHLEDSEMLSQADDFAGFGSINPERCASLIAH